MTPKEKAKELIHRFTYGCDSSRWITNNAKKSALIAVDEIIKTLPQSEYLEDRSEMIENRELIYWQQVKQEIENL